MPQDKLLRVQEMLDEALAGAMPKSQYRSLMGFLEWFAWCFVHPRSRMCPLMQIAFQLLQETAAWVNLIVNAQNLERASRHIKGKLNLFAEAESRGYHKLVSDLCRQLGIRRRQLPLSEAARQYLNQFAVEASPQVPLALQGLDVSPACIDHDGPTLEGYLASQSRSPSPARASSAGRTLELAPSFAYAAGVVPANRAALPGFHDTVLRHLEPALEGMLRDGLPSSHPLFGRLEEVWEPPTLGVNRRLRGRKAPPVSRTCVHRWEP